MARRSNLPAVLAVPLLADRLAVELETAAGMVGGEDPISLDRRAFLASAAEQVAQYGAATVDAPPAQYRPALVSEDLETRTG